MNEIFLSVTIDPAAAILAGKDQAGECNVVVKPSELTQVQRETLASLGPLDSPSRATFLLLPPLKRRLTHLDPGDVPGILDELKAKRDIEDEEMLLDLHKRYAEWRPAFLAKTIPVIGPIAAADPKAILNLPSRESHLIWFEQSSLSAQEIACPKAEFASVRSSVAEIFGSAYSTSHGWSSRTSRYEMAILYETMRRDDLAGNTVKGFLKNDKQVMENVRAAQESAGQIEAQVAEIHTALKRQAEASKSSRISDIAKWIAENGTDLQKKRFSSKLVSEQQALLYVRESEFAPLKDIARFKKISATEIRAAAAASHRGDLLLLTAPTFEFEVREAKDLTDRQIEVFERLQQLMPEARITVNEHIGYYAGRNEAGDPIVTRLSAYVQVQIGEVTLSRELAID